ncbi:MAG: hypothetical protein VB934_21820, partial [Polyangiaceae bacterium]
MDTEQLEQYLPVGPEQAGDIAPVEEDFDLLANLVEEGLEVETVALVFEGHESRSQAAELLEATRVFALGYTLLHELAGFEHFEGDKAVERSEGRFPQVGVDRGLGSQAR